MHQIYKPLNFIEYVYQIVGVGKHLGIGDDEISVRSSPLCSFVFFQLEKTKQQKIIVIILGQSYEIYKCQKIPDYLMVHNY